MRVWQIDLLLLSLDMPSLPTNPCGEIYGDSSLAPTRLLLVNQGGETEVGSDLSRGKPETSSCLMWTEN